MNNCGKTKSTVLDLSTVLYRNYTCKKLKCYYIEIDVVIPEMLMDPPNIAKRSQQVGTSFFVFLVSLGARLVFVFLLSLHEPRLLKIPGY